GLIPAAAVIGWLTKTRRTPLYIAGACCVGLAVLYLVGLPYMAVVLNVYLGKGLSAGTILLTGMLLYLPGDGLKIAATAALSPILLKALDRQKTAAE
ncbi:MAG: biotin transporter BioY, partial [Oscillospiraceae bacterium]